MHRAVVHALNEIDAALGSGDCFRNKADVATLREHLERWGRQADDMAAPRKVAMNVYVAGPYTSTEPPSGMDFWEVGSEGQHNVQRAIHAGQDLAEGGHTPFVPHLFALWDLVRPNGYEFYMTMCLAYVAKSDALVRLSGDSPGADREVELAKSLNIPIYYSVAAFLGAPL